MEKPEPPPATKKRLRISTKVLLFEVIWILAAILVLYIDSTYYYYENDYLSMLYVALYFGIFVIGGILIIAVLKEHKQLYAKGIPRLIGFLVIVLIFLQIQNVYFDAWRDTRSELRYREYTVKKLGEALVKYAKAYRGNLPLSDNWCGKIDSFDPKLVSGSFDAKARLEPHCTVAFNKNLNGANLQSLTLDTVLLFEADGPWNLSGGVELLKTQAKTQADEKEFAFVFLADGGTYKYFFSQDKVKNKSNESYRAVRWNP